jgi:adenylylsulfate kinase-like enzyme
VIEESRQGFVLWLMGMSGAGKTTISFLLEGWLRAQGARVERLDGDEVRKHLSKGLGFSREDRDENIRRIGFVARLMFRQRHHCHRRGDFALSSRTAGGAIGNRRLC